MQSRDSGGVGQQGQSRALEGLPPKFVAAMRTLFDVLDDDKTGCVALTQIEQWWEKERQEGSSGGVPTGVIESLRKVATSDSGLLTFERFCAGLKICLLRNQKARETGGESTDCQSETEDSGRGKSRRRMLIPSTTLSIPAHLSEPGNGLLPHPPSAQSPGGPPKPPRLSANTFRKLGDGGTASDGDMEQQGVSASRKPRRRESHSRRHTLQSGIDYGLLKRMKAIEEERDVLMRGIQTVQRAEEWYNEQLGQVQERMRSLGQHGGSHQGPEPVGSAEAHRERLLFQNARIQEVNQHLNCLMASDMSFPLSMNLAVGGGHPTGATGGRQPGREAQVERLKEQNRLLTEEVGSKSQAISVLDQEKSALIRDLFQARARVRQAELGEAEATFM